MNNQEILEKAIQKAIDGGWNHPGPTYVPFVMSDRKHKLRVGQTDNGQVVHYRAVEEIIFDHDFAKALWGIYPQIEVHMMPELSFTRDSIPTVDIISYPTHRYEVWQYHLQQMVIAEDPIKYLASVLQLRQ